jgi:hypothetical protein
MISDTDKNTELISQIRTGTAQEIRALARWRAKGLGKG